ncbi:hypothetical protein L249_2149, partial [Ophiocordyceps polyrhachis-furcata BCC 54312]
YNADNRRKGRKEGISRRWRRRKKKTLLPSNNNNNNQGKRTERTAGDRNSTKRIGGLISCFGCWAQEQGFRHTGKGNGLGVDARRGGQRDNSYIPK